MRMNANSVYPWNHQCTLLTINPYLGFNLNIICFLVIVTFLTRWTTVHWFLRFLFNFALRGRRSTWLLHCKNNDYCMTSVSKLQPIFTCDNKLQYVVNVGVSFCESKYLIQSLMETLQYLVGHSLRLLVDCSIYHKCEVASMIAEAEGIALLNIHHIPHHHTFDNDAEYTQRNTILKLMPLRGFLLDKQSLFALFIILNFLSPVCWVWWI